MARPVPFNRGGIFGLATVGAPTVTDASVTFNFEEHPYVNAPYNGDVNIRITSPIPTGTTGTLPVFFKTGNRAPVAVTKVGGAPLTAADITGTGMYKFFYDFRTGTVEAYVSVV